MDLDLYVDTSRKGVSMALAGMGPDGRVYEEIVNPDGRGEILGSSLDELLGRMNATLEDVKRVMVTLGPGSFSGLRTGVAFCQGLSFSGKRELYGVTTLQALACFGASSDTSAASSDQIETAVVTRARTGFWYLRLNGEESFIETPDVVARLEKSQVKTIVADSPAQEDEALKAVFVEIGACVTPDTGKPIDMWKPLFDCIKPSLIQEANYIQPSYFEKLKS